jgi:hypothetical protein
VIEDSTGYGGTVGAPVARDIWTSCGEGSA